MKLLITGIAGFIGSSIAREAIRRGHDVIGVDDLSKGYRHNVPAEAQFIEADLAHKEMYDRLPIQVDAILHLAGQSSGEISFDNPVADLEKNTVSTLNLIDYGIRIGAPRIIYASSMSVYGTTEDKAIAEQQPCYPLSCYGVGKRAAENYLEIYKDKLPYTAFRMFNVYGPAQDMKNLRQGMVSIYLAHALNEGHIPVKGAFDRFRDFVFIDDVVNLWLQAAERDVMPNRAFNLGTGVKTTIGALLEEIKILLPDTTWTQVPGTPGDQFGIYADTALLKQHFNLPHFTSLHDGLSLFCQWAEQESKKL